MLLVIAVSVSSISPVTCECLNIPSNCPSVSSSKLMSVSVTSVANSAAVLVVLLESNLKTVVNISCVGCGSTTTGVMEAT